MRPSAISALLVMSLMCNLVFADEEKMAEAENSLFRPAFSLGFSYPLVLSASLGTLLPLWRQDPRNPFPTSPSLRIDGEIGLGGGSAAAGIYLPVGGPFIINLKAVRMRTWLLTWNEESNSTFDGSVVELAIPSWHGGPKIGVGSFRDIEEISNRRGSFTYVFFGVGW